LKLAFIFVCAFLGVMLAVAAALAFFKALGKLVEWLKITTGRSETDVMLFLYVVFMALVIAGGITLAVESGESH
jgi:hypothetical protein